MKQTFENPGYFSGQGHICTLLAHLELKMNCVIDVMSLSNIWLGVLLSINNDAYILRRQLANNYI